MSALVPSIEPYSVGVINDTEFPGQSALNFKSVLVEYLMESAETLNLSLRLSPMTQSITDLQTAYAQIILFPLNP